MVLTALGSACLRRLERTAQARDAFGRNLCRPASPHHDVTIHANVVGGRVPSLFHTVPNEMVGTVLYPLNELEHVDRSAWERERAKYAGREPVLELRVPPLECLWNDVLHLSPVHPADIVAELHAVGLEPRRSRFFEIDAAGLDAARTVVFVNRRAGNSREIDASQWLPFEADALPAFAGLNEASRRYYRECAEAGRRPLLWGYLPHVLHRGALD